MMSPRQAVLCRLEISSSASHSFNFSLSERGLLGTAKERRAQPRSFGRRGGMSFHGSSSRGAPDFDPKVSGAFVSFAIVEGQSGAARREEGKRWRKRSRSAKCRRNKLELQNPRSGQLRRFLPSCVRTHILVIPSASGNHADICNMAQHQAMGQACGRMSYPELHHALFLAGAMTWVACACLYLAPCLCQIYVGSRC